MKFSYLFTALLATLTVANPIANPEATEQNDAAVAELDARASRGGRGGHHGGHGGHGGSSGHHEPKVVETNAYKRAKHAVGHHAFNNGHWYWFTQTWARGAFHDDEDDEDLARIRDHLGFDHIAIIAGEVVEKTSGKKGVNEVIHKDFAGHMYDLIDDDGDTEAGFEKFAPRKPTGTSTTLHYKGTTTKSKVAHLKALGEAYVHENPEYDPDENNCNDYVNALKKHI